MWTSKCCAGSPRDDKPPRHASHIIGVDHHRLRAATASLDPVKRVSRVRWLITNADPALESAGETWLRMIVTQGGYSVRWQVSITDGSFRARVDLLIEGSNAILEFDGLVRHNLTDEVAARRTMVDERRQQARLDVPGYRVVGFIWEEAHRGR